MSNIPVSRPKIPVYARPVMVRRWSPHYEEWVEYSFMNYKDALDFMIGEANDGIGREERYEVKEL